MSSQAWRIFSLILLAAALWMLPPSAHGQAVSGSITGLVNDPSQAAISNAAVTITNVETGVSTNRTTDATGRFVATNLNPGEYRIEVEAPGFQRFVQENVILRVDETVRVDIVMQLGQVTEQVTVSSAPPALQTEKTDVGESFSENEVKDLPTFGRNLSKLYNTVPGVVQNVFQIGAGENPSEFNGTLVNGQFFGNNTYEIDGIDDTAFGFSGFQIIVPNQEAVQEMKITTTAYDPEFGNSAGLVAQYVTKSGTNELHGSAFWFNRNDDFFAADPFTEKLPGTGPDGTGFGVAPFNWNQFGAAAGGPIKRNKVFIFGDIQLTRQRAGAQKRATVPNDAFRQGDFSAFADANPIFDPLSGDSQGAGRSLFPNNTIPQSRISPVARNLLDLLPAPNLGQGTELNFAGGGSVAQDTEQWDVRSDYNIGDKAKMFGRYTLMESELLNPALFGVAGGPAIGSLSPQTGDFRSQSAALNYTRTFDPTLLTEVRLGFTRFRLDGFQIDAGRRTNDEVGIPNINTDDILTQGLAGINVGGPVGAWFMGIPSGVGIPRLDRTTAFQVVNNWTKIAGKHQFRFGLDIRRNWFDFIATNASSRGNFTFNPSITGNAESPASGLGTASFLLGMPSNFDRAVLKSFTAERLWRNAYYFQDTWRVTPKLTLNLGIRYDYIEPVHPRFDGGLANFDPNTGEILLAGLGDVSSTANVESDGNNFAPRVGFAYKLTNDTVIRAGAGRSYFVSNYGAGFFFLTSFFPIAAQQTIQQDNIRFPIFPLDQGPPAPLSVCAVASCSPEEVPGGRLQAPPGELLKHRPFDNRTEYVDSWNFTIEHQFAQDFTMSLAYVGNVGRKLWTQVNINAAPPAPGPVADRRPFNNQFGLSQPITSGGNRGVSSYNSLQFLVEKRYSSGYSLKSAFTWSKAIDELPGGFAFGDQSLNPFDFTSIRGPNFGNREVVWTLSHVWDLPFGKGQPIAGNASGALNALIGGWQFNGISTLASGTPVSPVMNDSSSLNADFGQRPDLAGDPSVPNKSRELFFDPSAFAEPQFATFGNAGRGIIAGPGLFTLDWSFFKTFDLNERFNLQFRAEFFNFLNRANLGQPVNAVDSPVAGQIFNLAGAAGFGGAGAIPMRRMQFGLRLGW